jgi:hypothetical protein
MFTAVSVKSDDLNSLGGCEVTVIKSYVKTSEVLQVNDMINNSFT